MPSRKSAWIDVTIPFANGMHGWPGNPPTVIKPHASLAKGDVYVPSKTGAILYFDVPAIDPVLERAVANGGKVLYPKKDIGEAGFVAEIEDSEGNRIALSAPAGNK
jgi:hypothetical protein